MSFGDFSRINTNVQALGSLRTLQNTNNQLGMRQLRLATGSRLVSQIDTAIQSVADKVASVGDSQKRLTYKEQNLAVSMNNYEAARSRIADADFAREQMEIVKLQILQQTGTASLAQANAAPQAVLSLF